METAIRNYEDVDSWKTVMFLYTSALKEVGTKLEILNDEFQHVHSYNPIEHLEICLITYHLCQLIYIRSKRTHQDKN